MAKKKNPCKFILLKTGEELNYDQARDFLFKNYDFNTKTLKSESYAVSIERPGEVSIQPEAGISREMAEGAPQAKPEVTAEKGKVEEKIENITDSNVEQIGKTILAYHATPTGEVKSGKEAGIHIGTEKAAEQVKEARNLGKGQVVPVTVKINKPLVLSDMPTWSSNNLLAQLYNPSEGKYFGLSREQIRQVRDSDMTEKQKQQWVIDYLKKQGYDAIAYKNEAEDPGKYSYVVFDEKQITPTEYEKATKEPAMLEGVRDGRPEEKGREVSPELRAEEEAKREEEVKPLEQRIAEEQERLEKILFGDVDTSKKKKSLASKVRQAKIDTKGKAFDATLGLPVAVYNSAVEIVAKAIEGGSTVAKAIQRAVKFIDSQMKGKDWNRGVFYKNMNVRYQVTLPQGGSAVVEVDNSKKTAEVIDGWYSPLEQTLLDTKQERLPAKQWLDRFAKTEEAKWTGLQDWLSNQDGTVSKQDILDYLKDNRVQVVTVVKGSYKEGFLNDQWTAGAEENEGTGRIWKNNGWKVVENSKYNYSIFYPDGSQLDGSWSTKDGAFGRVRMEAPSGTTKFSQYQLEGEKDNYKEVLVTLPRTGEIEYVIVDKKDGREVWVEKTKEEAQVYIQKVSDPSKYIIVQKKGFPKEGKQFQSTHFEEPNILVHLRMNTRTDADGKKVLFVEEIQSDWGQTGKKEGFADKTKKAEYEKLKKEFESLPAEKLKIPLSPEIEAMADKLDKLEMLAGKGAIPTAPFVMDTNAWTKLGLKVALKEAVAQGVDKIAWTTGEQQNERYDLRKSVDKLEWVYDKSLSKPTGTLYGWKDGKMIMEETIPENRLEDYIGKGVAENLLKASENDSPNYKGYSQKTLTGDEIKVGGKGMKGFYGSMEEGTKGIVGGVAESLFGQKVGETKINKGTDDLTKNEALDLLKQGEKIYTYNRGNIFRLYDEKDINEATNYFSKKGEAKSTQPSIDITPQLIESVEKGLPLFEGALSINDRIKQEKQKLSDLFSQTTRMGFAFDPKKQAEVQYNIHKTLVNLAKLYVEKGINTVVDFAKALKLKVQDVQRAWDEANGGKVITEKMLEREPYDQDSIRKAILSEQINYAQTQSEQTAEQAINNGNTVFDDFDAAMTGDAVYDLMTPSQKKDFYNEQIAAFNTKAAIEQSQQTPPPIDPATWWQRFKIRYINSQSRIKDIQKEFIERGMQIMKESNAALKYELMIGKAQSKIEDVMNTAKDIYSRLKKDGGNVEELGLYMYALHAKERNENVAKERMEEFNEERKRLEDIISDSASTTKEVANAKKDLDDLVKGKGKVKLLPDGGSGMMNQTAAEIIQAVEDSGKKDLYDQYAKEFRDKIIIPRVEQMLDYGLIDRDQADKLLTQYQHYVPLQVVEKQGKGAITGTKGAGVRGKDVFKARGSALYNYTERYNPIFSAVWNFNSTISRGEANVAGKALLELAKLDKDNLVFEVGKPKYMPMYDSNGDIKGVIPFPSSFTDKNSIELKVDGKPVFIKIKDTELLNSMKKNGVMRGIRGLAIINGWIRNGATLANPEFIVSNFIRDYGSTLFNLMSVKKEYSNIDFKGLTREIANPKNVYKAGKAIISDYKGDNTGEWGKYAKMYREYGGRTSWFLNENLDDFSKKMEKNIKQMGQGGSFGVKALNYIGEKMYMGQLAAEQSMRLSTFKALIEKGVDPEDAASAAKNITVNFENKGTIMEFIDSLYLFASAQIKGTYRVTKTLVTSKKGQAFAAGLFAYGILESYLNDILGGEDDEEDKINEGDKERSFIIMHPKDPKAEPIKIPLFYGMNVFKYAGNVAYDVYTGKKSALDGSLTVLKSIYNQVSPFQGPTLSQSLAPTAFDPFIQQAENKSYTAAPIKPEQPKFGPKKKESELYFKSARPFSIAAAKYMNELTGGGKYERGAIDVSPELIDHYYDAFTLGAGRFIANSAQTAFIAGQKIKARFEKEDAPPMELKNIPFVRLFRGGTKDKEYIKTVYDIWTNSGVDKLTPTQMERFNMNIKKAKQAGVIDEEKANELTKDIEKNQLLIDRQDFVEQSYRFINDYIKRNNYAPLTPEQEKTVDKFIRNNALLEEPDSFESQLDIIKDEITFKKK